MELGFFETFIEDQYNDKLIKTKNPNPKGEVMVCCPFPHKKVDENWETVEYKELIPSSSINLDKRLFNCLVCGEGSNELKFAQRVTGKSEKDIIKDYAIVEELKSDTDNWSENQHKLLLQNEEMLSKLYELKITDEVINELNLGYMTNMLAIPCFKNGKLVDIVRYNINKTEGVNKVLRNANSLSGNIIPFDLWKNDKRITVICEGEKDMLVARSQGLNAISITGGAQYGDLQKDTLPYFKDRNAYIVFDNDNAGREGSLKLYKSLVVQSNNVAITDISSICVENKEDVADFFIKYDKTSEDFKDLLKNNSGKPKEETLKTVKTKYEIPYSKISDNIENSIMRKTLKSRFQIVATCSEMFSVHEFVEFRPTNKDEDDSLLASDDKNKPKFWHLYENLGNFMEFIEMGVKAKDLTPTFARILGIKVKQGEVIGYKPEYGKLKTVYKYTVADEVVENDDYVSEITVDMYAFEPLDIGNSYEIEYKLFPHSKDGQRIVAVATKIVKTNDDLENMSDEMLESLDLFKAVTPIKDKIDELYSSAKNHIAPYLNKDLWFICDLVFNSPLDITYINQIRGALDVFILGDTRTGKSETSRALRELYNFGSVVPLKTATTQSLIGGTSDRDKKTKLGILPREHKGIAILEEYSGAPLNFTSTMTEIRSSGILKLYRVNSGELKAPCKLRMITISNPTSNDDGMPRLLSIFPNGIEPLVELVKSAEDIARYDAFMLVPRVVERLNPFESTLSTISKIDKKHYENKIKWVRSLKANEVVISPEVGNHIFKRSQSLNNMFECNFTLFGAETDKKLARFSCALATMLCSTDETNRNIIVTIEHVDYIYDFFMKIYNNDTFRLREYADEQKAYALVSIEDTQLLQSLYSKNTTIIELLSGKSKTNRNEMSVASGQDRDVFNKFFNILVARKFIRLARDQVMPTEKFRATYRLLDKSFTLNDIENCTIDVEVPF